MATLCRSPQPSRVLAELDFLPNSLASLQIGENDTLIAAGGQETELHLSYHTPSTSSDRQTRVVWQADHRLTGSINNSVLLTSLNLTGSNESSVEPRVGISNNDGSVRLYDVPIRVQSPRRKPQEVGTLKLDVPVNHCKSHFLSSLLYSFQNYYPFIRDDRGALHHVTLLFQDVLRHFSLPLQFLPFLFVIQSTRDDSNFDRTVGCGLSYPD